MKKIFNKKFFKVLLITILVLSSVGGTVYVFYSQMTKRQDSFACVSEYIVGGEKAEVNNKLKSVNTNLTRDGDERLVIMVETVTRLDNITTILNKYLINAKDYENVDENKIVEQLKNAQVQMKKLDVMLDEYLLKSQSLDFNKHEGAKYLYKGAADYIVAYTGLIDEINTQISKLLVNKNADIKFSLFEIYSNCCKQTFSNFNTSGLIEVQNEHNIKFLNQKFSFDDIVLLQGNNYIVQNKFLDAYSKCNKYKFANGLVCDENDYSNLDFVDGMTEEQVDLQKPEIRATYYFKRIFIDG